VLLPRQQAKLARGAKDKEHAMSETPNTAIAVIGIDIGKNSFHVVGHDARGAIALQQKWSCGQVEARLANIPTLPGRHGGLRRRTSPEPQARIAWSRCQVDAGQICSPLAVEVQRGMVHSADVTQDLRIEFRIGVHVGDIIIDDNDMFGDGANIAVRLEGIAEPGGVCISDDAYRQIRGKVDIVFDDMGPRSLVLEEYCRTGAHVALPD
jgi:hypothetical protein